MRGAILALLALSGGAAGCLFRTPTDLQREQAHTLRPTEVDATPIATAEPPLPRRVFRLRARVDADYRAQVVRWSSSVPAQLERAGRILEAQLGVRIEVESVRAWDHSSGSGDLLQAVRELAAADPGEDVDWVVGFVSSMDTLTALQEQLGAALLGGRHLVLRGMSSFAEAEALRRHFDKLPERELDDLLRERQRHKEVAVLLHEWAHTLGVQHDDSTRWLMAQAYEPSQSAFSPESLRQLVEGLRGRAAPGAAATATAEASVPLPAGPPRRPLPPDELAVLREAAAHEEAGRLDAAWKLLAPLAARRLEEVQLQEAACLLAAKRAWRDQATLETCRRAAALEGTGATALLVLADLASRRERLDEARRALARGEHEAARSGPANLWPAIASLHDRLGNCTGAERVAARPGVQVPPALVADCARQRRELALPRGGRAVPEEREGDYVRRLRGALAMVRLGQLGGARTEGRKLAADFPGAAGGSLVDCLAAAQARDDKGVAAACKATVEAAPEAVRAHLELGLGAGRARRLEAAHAHRRRAVDLDDGAGPAWNALATCCERLGHTEELAELRRRYRERQGTELRPEPLEAPPARAPAAVPR